MNTIKILVDRELHSYFNSWSIYIGYILFFCICGFFTWFSRDNLFYIGQANLIPFFSIVNWAQFILVPALTMKSFADEKKNGTLELILTKPIRTSQLILGKFFSNWLIAITALALTLPYYVTIAMLGHIDHGATILGYIGLALIVGCHISIGIFASSLSRTPVTAFFINIGIGFCFQLLFGLIGAQIGTGFFANMFTYLSVEDHFDSLSRGILDSKDIIYFASVIIIFLTLTKVSVCKSRF